MKFKKSIAVFMILCLVLTNFSHGTIIEANSVSNLEEGTEGNPFLISNVEEFKRISNNLNSYYKLTEDLDFNGEIVTPIGTSTMPFKGSLDGDGHAI
ncbi:MAG: hypothetical protein ACERKN_17405, partial [Velocimicrobium sp.]